MPPIAMLHVGRLLEVQNVRGARSVAGDVPTQVGHVAKPRFKVIGVELDATDLASLHGRRPLPSRVIAIQAPRAETRPRRGHKPAAPTTSCNNDLPLGWLRICRRID